MYQTRSRSPLERLRRLRPTLLGPAFVAAIAYVDPGNFATNLVSGSRYGTLLLWVVVVSNAMAMLIQYLSAKVGIATGRGLAELCRDTFPRGVTVGLWVQAEVVVVATDLAEVLGGALALNLLFRTPLLVGGVITGLVAFLLLGLQDRGARRFEIVVGGLLLVILAGFLYSLLVGHVQVAGSAAGLVPRLHGTDSLLMATGMLGATVMPHAIYLHGALVPGRSPRTTAHQQRRLLHSQRVDVVAAMTIAGLVNVMMLLVAARVFHDGSHPVATIEQAHAGLGEALGSGAALLFAIALLASGLAASGVGTLAGQVVMQGFLRRRVSRALRRLVTLVPAIGVIALHVDATRALVLSQVVLSFGIPMALVPLVMLTSRADLMGTLVNRRATTVAATAVAAVISGLNVTLVVATVTA